MLDPLVALKKYVNIVDVTEVNGLSIPVMSESLIPEQFGKSYSVGCGGQHDETL